MQTSKNAFAKCMHTMGEQSLERVSRNLSHTYAILTYKWCVLIPQTSFRRPSHDGINLNIGGNVNA